MLKTLFTLAVLLAYLHASPCSANFRPARDWAYPELMNEADLVVIGIPVWTEVAKDAPPGQRRQLRTSIDVRLTIKGIRGLGPIDLTYFEFVPTVVGQRLIMERPGNSAQYLQLTTTAELKRNAKPGEKPPDPEYLFFLKLRPDGTYEPVSGHYDPVFSVKRLQPLKDSGSTPLRARDE